MGGNRRFGQTRPIWWSAALLVILIVVPGLILGLMAIRSADREEAFVEKQLRTAFLAEVAPTAERIELLLLRIEAELDSTAAALPGAAAGGLELWRRSVPLVGVPFLFDRGGAFIRPDLNSPLLSAAESDFLNLNLDFFLDRKSVEVYRNVLDEYSDQILDFKRESASAEIPAGQRKDRTAAERRQEALNAFEESAELQKSVYEDALKSGRSPAARNLRPTLTQEADLAEAAPSLYVTESLRFSQIIGQADHGVIPRLVDDRMMLLFWKKTAGNRVLGCALDPEALRSRIVETLPVVSTPVRILTVLDHAGRPLLEPDPGEAREWSFPFVSREISGRLPRWEVAVYLADPGIISSRAHTQVLTIALLVVLLVVSILTGGLVLVRLLRSELRLAEQKTTFVANVSHELKTPLTSIRLFAEMLRDGKQRDPEKQTTYLSIMVSEAERLTRLINNVLDFSRLHRSGKQYTPRLFDPGHLCRELVEVQRVRLQHEGFTVEYVEHPGALVRADPEAIRQVLLNLISNAEKYSPEEKWIRVEVRREKEECVIGVADHGVGIAPRDASRIFKEFYRADDTLTAKVRGTGLGLTISRRIARDHGGEIVYAPNNPRGSLFELRLPCAEAE